MEDTQNQVYYYRNHFVVPSYFVHNSPPHVQIYANNDSDNTLLQPLVTPPQSDEANQMHYLRFPTPPITPPRTVSTQTAGSAAQTRTLSVIMKVGQGQYNSSGQHVAVELSTLEKTKLMSHETAVCSDFLCNWIGCGKYFECLELLAAHVTQVHAIASPTDGLYYCRWTGCPRTERGFNARYKMLVHVRTHTKEKPHQCHLCEKNFSRAENLKIHIRSHSGEKPYACTFEGCSKKYSNSSDRFKHTRTHSTEKPYMCKVAGCQKRYTDPSSLRKHVKTFKHSIQLIGSVNTSTEHHYRSKVLDASPIYKEEQQNSAYLCMPAAPATERYYLGVVPEDVCHIKAAHLQCYYGTEAASATNYWLVDEPRKAAHLNYEYTMDVDMETQLDVPLDLRVNQRR